MGLCITAGLVVGGLDLLERRGFAPHAYLAEEPEGSGLIPGFFVDTGEFEGTPGEGVGTPRNGRTGDRPP